MCIKNHEGHEIESYNGKMIREGKLKDPESVIHHNRGFIWCKNCQDYEKPKLNRKTEVLDREEIEEVNWIR